MRGRAFACQPVAAGRGRAHVASMADKAKSGDREREERLAAALRENLRRRKAQARATAGPETEDDANREG